MFRIIDGKGFQVDFANGFELSVMFGPNNYCDNRKLTGFEIEGGGIECKNAEIAVFRGEETIYADNDGKYVYNGGWASPGDFARIVRIVEMIPAGCNAEIARQLIINAMK